MAYCSALLAVMQHLMGGGLTDVEQRFARQVMRLDLVSSHDRSRHEAVRFCPHALSKQPHHQLLRLRRHYNAVRPHSSLGYRPPAPEAILPPARGLPYAALRSADGLADRGRILT